MWFCQSFLPLSDVGGKIQFENYFRTKCKYQQIETLVISNWTPPQNNTKKLKISKFPKELFPFSIKNTKKINKQNKEKLGLFLFIFPEKKEKSMKYISTASIVFCRSFLTYKSGKWENFTHTSVYYIREKYYNNNMKMDCMEN